MYKQVLCSVTSTTSLCKLCFVMFKWLKGKNRQHKIGFVVAFHHFKLQRKHSVCTGMSFRNFGSHAQ